MARGSRRNARWLAGAARDLRGNTRWLAGKATGELLARPPDASHDLPMTPTGRLLLSTIGIFTLALLACAPPYLDPADYHRTCAQDTNCALVLLTDICNCLEPPSAVSVREVPRAQADLEDVRWK